MIRYIYDESGNIVTTYTYDAWGRQVSVTGSNVTLGNLNPIRYKSYFYDSDTGFYYLETRFYDPTVGCFISPDDPAYLGASGSALGWNLFSYCENEPVGWSDSDGNWAEKYSGFKWTPKGFDVKPSVSFLSRAFCLLYATDIIRLKGSLRGKWNWSMGKYCSMTPLRMAQEIWFHALVYYFDKAMPDVLKVIANVTNKDYEEIKKSAAVINVNSDDKRAKVYAAVWNAGYTVKTRIKKRLGIQYPFTYISI